MAPPEDSVEVEARVLASRAGGVAFASGGLLVAFSALLPGVHLHAYVRFAVLQTIVWGFFMATPWAAAIIRASLSRRIFRKEK